MVRRSPMGIRSAAFAAVDQGWGMEYGHRGAHPTGMDSGYGHSWIGKARERAPGGEAGSEAAGAGPPLMNSTPTGIPNTGIPTTSKPAGGPIQG